MNIENLNSQQKLAVETVGGPMLVFAGAGSGKTRVLTYKIAYLIQNIGLPPENILAVTFTNKASQEMKVRISELVEHDISAISIGTFHSIGALILRRHINLIGFTNDFTIYDQADSKSLIKKIIKKLNLDLKVFDPKSIQIRISNSKNNMDKIEDLKKMALNFNEEKFVEIFEMYIKELQSNNAVDFDDLLILPLKIFQLSSDVLHFYQEKFQYVLVDEYQDTNKPQFELVSMFSKIHKNIFVVGDDDQSIYGWRGADISNILNFQNIFEKSKIVKLEQNYRSTKTILDAAWSVVSKNSERADKKLWTENSIGEKIKLIESINEKDEANKIIIDIESKVKSLKVKKDKFVVLYRTNAQSRAIEDQLRKSGIPYQIIGGTKFYDRKEIKDIMAYLKFISNNKDSISFTRIINFPHRGIGKTTVDKILNKTTSNNFIDVLLDADNLDVSIKQKDTLKKIGKLLAELTKRAVIENPAIIVNDLLDAIKIKDFYENNTTSDSMDRWANIEELVVSIEDYQHNNKENTLSDYLEEVSLLTDIDRWNDKNDVLTLMTIHSAKGLEFDFVYLVGLEDGLFPMIRGYDEMDLEEERRLFYVALTRAQKSVFMTYAKTRMRFGGQPNVTIKSRFINEIPGNLLLAEYKKPKFGENKQNLNLVSNNNIEIKLHSLVEHKIFGKGKVISVEGEGQNSKIVILFNNNERKKLIYKYANLKILS